MPIADKALSLEIAVEPGKEALAAYSDPVLDHATRLVISHRTRNLSAEVVLDGVRVVFRCGQASQEQADRLRGFDSILWARLEGDHAMAMAELKFEHQG